jgi:hypothetical protein
MAAALLTLGGCDRPADAPLSFTPEFAGPRLARLKELFGPKLFGVQVAYLESIAGPAMRIAPAKDGEERRTYEVDRCTFFVDAAKGEIAGFGVETAALCPVAIDAFLPDREFPALKALTFGAFDAGAGSPGTFTADCLELCPNLADPVVTEAWDGPHADDFIHVELSAPLVDDAAIAAAQTWAAALKADGDPNAGAAKGDHQEAARAAFKAVHPTAIAFHREQGAHATSGTGGLSTAVSPQRPVTGTSAPSAARRAASSASTR